MPSRKHASIVTSLSQPKSLCCQHCGADDSLIPEASSIETLFGDMGMHIDLIDGNPSHEMPREMPIGTHLQEIRLRCRSKACRGLTMLFITAGENGTFLQLVAADEAEETE